MKTKEAADWAGGVRQLALLLGVSVQAVYMWGERPPMLRQDQIERLTRGELKAGDISNDH